MLDIPPNKSKRKSEGDHTNGNRKMSVSTGDVNQQTQDVDLMMVQCWPTVCDAGPALNHQQVNVTCLLRYFAGVLLGRYIYIRIRFKLRWNTIFWRCSLRFVADHKLVNNVCHCYVYIH